MHTYTSTDTEKDRCGEGEKKRHGHNFRLKNLFMPQKNQKLCSFFLHGIYYYSEFEWNIFSLILKFAITLKRIIKF